MICFYNKLMMPILLITMPSLHIVKSNQLKKNVGGRKCTRAASPKHDVRGRAYRSASRARNQPRLRVHPQTGLAPPTAHDAVVRAHRRDVDVDVNPGPATIGVVRLLDPPFVHFVEPVRRRGHDVENEPPKAEFATRPPRRTTGATAADHPGPAGSAP